MPGHKLLITTFTILFLCFVVPISAQEIAATLNGTVTDASGRVVPSARVTIVQNGVNGASRTIQTNAEGSYTITHLTPGNYTVSVTADGFETFTAQNVILFVAQTRSVNATLRPGAVVETVTVQQNAVSVDTTTSALAGTISGKQVTELMLNGRNFEQLVTLQPGVVNDLPDAGLGPSNTSTIAVNGARATANNWTVDGAEINDSGSNAAILNIPSVDAIQEFTLERSTYDAGYGRSGGGQVLVATKSGTSAFQGDVYEFDRNNVFNANNYFNKRAGLARAIERYNDYGFTVGGPLYIPKIYNTERAKTFFFWSEEWRKISSPATSSVISPTQDQLNGMFTGPITDAPAGCVAYDATTNQSTISNACYSKNAQVYLANIYDKFPANSDGRYIQTYSQPDNTREDMVRVDQNINEKLHLFGRAMLDENPQIMPEGLFASSNYVGVAGTANNTPGANVVGNLIWTISPRMVNEAEFAYTQGTNSSTFLPGAAVDSPTVSSELTNNTAYIDPYGRIPAISYTGSTIQGLSMSDAPYHERNLDRTFFDNFSVTFGKHTMRAGVTFSQMLKTENASSGFATFLFDDFQDFLLGNVATYTQPSRDTVPDLHYVNAETFMQDDWQVTKNLTVNLGLRYSFFPAPADVADTMNNFSPLLFDQSKAPAIDPVTGNFVSAQGQIPATYVNGLIFPTGKACAQAQAIAAGATCSPFGSHVNPTPKANFAPRFGFAYVPYQNRKIAIHGGYGIFYDRMLNGIWEDNAFNNPPLVQTATVNHTSFDNPMQGSLSVSLGPNHINSTGDPTMKNPSYMDYNLSVQDEVMPNTLVEMAYVGSLGRHLLGERDINQPTLAERQADPTAYVTAVVPYAGFSWFADYLTEYSSNYNSLQVSLNHRTEHGLTLGIAYTWGKTLTNMSSDQTAGTYNTYDPNRDYGPSSLNQPQTFVANYVYELPFYKGQRGLVGHTLGGWEVSGITALQSGESLTVNQAADNFDCQTPAGATSGCVAGTYPGGINIDATGGLIAPRPDLLAPVHLMKQQAQWFTTSSFADAIGHFGSEGTGSLLGPGLIDFDLAAMKNIKVREGVSFQLRGEFFNAFNHTNFETVDAGLNDGTFGQVTATHDPRELQLGGKIYF